MSHCRNFVLAFIFGCMKATGTGTVSFIVNEIHGVTLFGYMLQY